MQKISIKEIVRALKFTIISISAGIIQIISYTLFFELLGWNHWVSYLISLLLSIIYNFTINRKVTFKSHNNVKIAMLLVFLFYVVFTPVSTYIGYLLTNNGINNYLVEIVTMISNFVLEYLYNRLIVYKNSCDMTN